MKAQIENQKQAIRDMAEIDPALIGKIPRVDSFPEVIAGAKKLADLQEQKKVIEQQLNSFYEGPAVAGPALPTISSDAEKVLAGTAVATLPGQTKNTDKDNLCRQRDILAEAVTMQTENNRATEARIIREVCEGNLSGFAKKFIVDVIEDFEMLAEDIEKELKFFAFLSSQGYTENLRPTGWAVTSYEIGLYFGGGIAALRYFIETRRSTWGLDENK